MSSKITIRLQYPQPVIISDKADRVVQVVMECEFQNYDVYHALDEVISGIQRQVEQAQKARRAQKAIPSDNPDSGL